MTLRVHWLDIINCMCLSARRWKCKSPCIHKLTNSCRSQCGCSSCACTMHAVHNHAVHRKMIKHRWHHKHDGDTHTMQATMASMKCARHMQPTREPNTYTYAQLHIHHHSSVQARSTVIISRWSKVIVICACTCPCMCAIYAILDTERVL